jgi:hypothetical protein
MRDVDMDAYDRKVAGLIEQYGMFVQGVLPDGSGDPSEPGFCYTVGLSAVDHPEFIVFSLPPEIAQTILNDLGFRILRGEVTVAAGDTIHQLVRNYPVRLVEVTDTTEHLTMANRFYSGPGLPVRALQVVFPDDAGRWPWEAESRTAGTPLLARSPPMSAGRSPCPRSRPATDPVE